jgi:uncharacterized membrane protein
MNRRQRDDQQGVGGGDGMSDYPGRRCGRNGAIVGETLSGMPCRTVLPDMKITLSLCIAALAMSAGHAQILRPQAVNGALLGGIAGAVIGHNSGELRHNAWRGAAIGAGTGLIAGEMIGNHSAARRGGQMPAGYRPEGGYVHRHSPVGYAVHRQGHWGHDWRQPYGHWSVGYGSAGHHHYPRLHRGYGYRGYRPAFTIDYWPYDYGYQYPVAYDSTYFRPAYSYPDYGYGSYGGRGLFWGGLAGAIIGHNTGAFRHNAWRGAAWGAGTGWLLGTLADANRRARYLPAEVMPAAPLAPAAPAAPAQPQQVTIINNYYNAPTTPMAAANGLFGRN